MFFSFYASTESSLATLAHQTQIFYLLDVCFEGAIHYCFDSFNRLDPDNISQMNAFSLQLGSFISDCQRTAEDSLPYQLDHHPLHAW